MKTLNCISAIGALFLFMAGVSTLDAATRNWNAATTGDWFTVGNWAETQVPAGGDDVYITASGASVLLTNSTDYLSSLTLSKTLIFSNWNTTLSATNVTIQSGGVVTLPPAFTTNAGAMSNNIYIICSNLTIQTGGLIDANYKGYAGGILTSNGFGPGASHGASAYAGGAGYGGAGGNGYEPWRGRGGITYGSATNPIAPGSGGGGAQTVGGAGGGAIRIQASGVVLLSGSCRADGTNCAFGDDGQGGGGSGGGILIVCNSLAGTNGSVSASGGHGMNSGGGSGGRIAVIYDTTAQSALPIPGISFSASPGGLGSYPSGSYYAYERGDLGTLYFPDNQFLTETITNLNGQWVGSSLWSPGSLMVSNAWIRFPADGFRLTVTNNVTISGASGKLELGGNQFITNRYLGLYSFLYSAGNGPTMTVGGNLVLTNAGCLSVYAGATNGSVTNYGALVDVSEDVWVHTNSWIYPGSHATNGGSVLFRVRNLTISTPNAGFNASARGYAGEAYNYQTPAYGPGAPLLHSRGAGYGGFGGGETQGGSTYGSSNAPVDPGSGGGGPDDPSRGVFEFGGYGGGLVRVQAAQRINVYGSILADGGKGQSYNGSGSGGGIYLYCRTFYGATNGLLSAKGGSGGWGGGGGGRIAVWRIFDGSTGVISNTVAFGSGGANAENGTVFWGWLPAPGAIFTIH